VRPLTSHPSADLLTRFLDLRLPTLAITSLAQETFGCENAQVVSIASSHHIETETRQPAVVTPAVSPAVSHSRLLHSMHPLVLAGSFTLLLLLAPWHRKRSRRGCFRSSVRRGSGLRPWHAITSLSSRSTPFPLPPSSFLLPPSSFLLPPSSFETWVLPRRPGTCARRMIHMQDEWCTHARGTRAMARLTCSASPPPAPSPPPPRPAQSHSLLLRPAGEWFDRYKQYSYVGAPWLKG
jgi:hypothetical protein